MKSTVLTMRKDKSTITSFQAKANADTLTLELYDIIGADFFGEGITAKKISDALISAGTFSDIVLRINSPGGDLFEGVAIYNLLKSQDKPVNVMVDGLAASAASLIAMAGDTCVMGDGACMMIHRAMAVVGGYADDLRKCADVMDTVTDSASDIYVARTGMKKKKVLELMTAETWMTSQEAVYEGFATATSPQKAKNITNAFDLSVFKNAPKSLTEIAASTEGCECECSDTTTAPKAEYDDYLVTILRHRVELLKRTK
jgi:ATP-dependent Clp protease protease subunit